MSIIANPIRGAFAQASVKVAQKGHLARFPARDMRRRGTEIFREMQIELKKIKGFNEDIKKGIIQKIDRDEMDILKIVDEVTEEIKQSVRDVMMIAHWQIGIITEVIKDNEEISAKGFPEGKAEELKRQALARLSKLNGLMRNSGSALMSGT
ncbi:MAG: hypothetical protein QF824_06025 [Candidatus Woesearchaeota archaeon]|nr:hypothetical protein [Candidatus Woesearchaeota archaeon]MDP7180798.1 hypothetical protein [Candidatus Woesearchaeota archaeon]